MRAIRGQMRSGRTDGLSVPQFRLLRFVRRNPGTSLSALADHVGTTLPATSQIVDRLVRSGFLTRIQAPEERRRIELRVTDTGAAGPVTIKHRLDFVFAIQASEGRPLKVLIRRKDEVRKLTVVPPLVPRFALMTALSFATSSSP